MRSLFLLRSLSLRRAHIPPSRPSLRREKCVFSTLLQSPVTHGEMQLTSSPRVCVCVCVCACVCLGSCTGLQLCVFSTAALQARTMSPTSAPSPRSENWASVSDICRSGTEDLQYECCHARTAHRRALSGRNAHCASHDLPSCVLCLVFCHQSPAQWMVQISKQLHSSEHTHTYILVLYTLSRGGREKKEEEEVIDDVCLQRTSYTCHASCNNMQMPPPPERTPDSTIDCGVIFTPSASSRRRTRVADSRAGAGAR